MPTDPSILLQGHIGKVIGEAYQLRQMRDQMQSQNALRNLMAKPDAVDPATGLPTTNTLAQLSRVSPEAAAKLAGQISTVQEHQAQTGHMESETQAARQKQDTEFLSTVVGDYDGAIKGGNVSPEIALQAARKKLRDHIMAAPVSDEAKQKAWEQVGSLDAAGLRNHAMTAEQRIAAQKFETTEADKTRTAEEREKHDRTTEGGKWEVLVDPKSNTAYRYNPGTHEATTLDGKPYSPEGAAKMGGGTPRSATQLAMSKFMQEHPDATASDVADFAAQYGAGVREQGAIGTKRGGIEFSASEVDRAAKVSKEAYSKLSRTQFMPFNKLKDAVERQTSSPEQAAAFAADNALVNGYGALASRGGVSTVSAQDHARAMLNTAQSQAAHDAVVDQMITEGKALSEGGDDATRIARQHHIEMDIDSQKPKAAQGSSYKNPNDVVAAFRSGKLSREAAKKALQDNGWAH